MLTGHVSYFSGFFPRTVRAHAGKDYGIFYCHQTPLLSQTFLPTKWSCTNSVWSRRSAGTKTKQSFSSCPVAALFYFVGAAPFHIRCTGLLWLVISMSTMKTRPYCQFLQKTRSCANWQMSVVTITFQLMSRKLIPSEYGFILFFCLFFGCGSKNLKNCSNTYSSLKTVTAHKTDIKAVMWFCVCVCKTGRVSKGTVALSLVYTGSELTKGSDTKP